MAGRVQWRRYVFFDKDIVHENIENVLKGRPTCISAEGGVLLLGDESGYVTLSDRNFNISWSHKIFNGPIRGVAYGYDVLNHKRQYIIVAGEENRSSSDTKSLTNERFVVKVFVASDMSKPIEAFHVATNVPEGSNITSFSTTSNGLQIAIGFDSGSIVLFSVTSSVDGTLSRQHVQEVLHTKHKSAVSNLFFCEPFQNVASKSSTDRYIRLYAVYDLANDREGAPPPSTALTSTLTPEEQELEQAAILVFDTSIIAPGSPFNRFAPRTLDERGARRGCSSLMKQTCELVVGRQEGVFSYSIEDRGGAAGLEGDKQIVSAVGRYILVACEDEKTQRTVVTIYDLRNKFISLTHLLPFGDTAAMVCQDGGVAYVVTSSNQLIRFREKDTTSKLDILLRKNLYPLAISLAAEEQSEVSEVMKLYKLYGDFLFKKSDFEAAVVQYCFTIGHVQPSYVIRRFLDTQKIIFLVVYLEQLHLRGIATKDHTSLLLTCYTKTSNEAKLTQFVNLCHPDATSFAASSESVSSSSSTVSTVPAFGYTTSKVPSSVLKKQMESAAAGGTAHATQKVVQVDVLAAIGCLRDAECDNHAAQLALYNKYHDEYLSIKLFSTSGQRDVEEALQHVVKLVLEEPMDNVVPLLLKYGRDFIRLKGDAFTGLLIQLCTGICFADLLVDASGTASKDKDPSRPAASASGRGDPVVLKEKLAIEEVLNIFPEDDFYLRVFLEGVCRTQQDSRSLSPRVKEILIELYLREYQGIKATLSDWEERGVADGSNPSYADAVNSLKLQEEKIMAVLDGGGSATNDYDITQALLLTHAFGFEPGELFLLEKMQSIDLILRKHIENRDDKGIMRVLRREGRKDPELYVQVLTYFVRLSLTLAGGNVSEGDVEVEDEDDEEGKWDHISEVLTLIDKESALTPMQVIPILSINPELPLHIMSRFIKKRMLQTSEDLHKLQADVMSVWGNIQNLMNEDKALKIIKADSHKSKTVGGFVALSDDLDEEDELEVLQAEAERDVEKKKWQDIKKSQTDRTADHEAFFSELEHSADGYSTIATYFGRWTLNLLDALLPDDHTPIPQRDYKKALSWLRRITDIA